MTLTRLFMPGQAVKYTNTAAFISTIYLLNLLNQGIYSYFRNDHHRWLSTVEPFPDIRGCCHAHGGVGHVPGTLLTFASNPSYIPGAVPIRIPRELFAELADFLVFTYLPNTCMSADLTPQRLIQRLIDDAECVELGALWGNDR
ncbi:MAG: hypothetical protein ACT4P4_08930 [Betaproteobacteria bacterium]